MEENTSEKLQLAMEKFLEFTTAKDSRRTLLKMYFATEREEKSRKDDEEVYLLYNLLEDIE